MGYSTTAIRIVSVLGVLLSAYALYVEHKKAEDELYVAACDINSWIACSKYVSWAAQQGIPAPSCQS